MENGTKSDPLAFFLSLADALRVEHCLAIESLEARLLVLEPRLELLVA